MRNSDNRYHSLSLTLILGLTVGCSQLPTESVQQEPAPEPEPFSEFISEEAIAAAEETPTVEPAQTQIEKDDLWQRISAGYKFAPAAERQRVRKLVTEYSKRPSSLHKALLQARPYIYHVTEQLDAADMPLELALLPLIESTYNPRAYSSGHAVGLWQFISSTANSMGLKRNRWYDARYDVVASTDAAIAHLQHLYNRFDDWSLALAAYNCGAGCVSRAIRKNQKQGKPADYWSLDLPRETERYVPKLIALAEIVADAERHNLQLPAVANTPFFDVIELPAQVDLNKVMQVTGISGEVLGQLNPAYRRSITPPGKDHFLLLPTDHAVEFREFLSATDPSEWVPYNEYIVARGDTLSHIAKRHNVPLRWIRDNNSLNKDNLSIGQILRIPRSGEPLPILSADRTTSYKVRAGDSLWKIARRFNTSVRQLRADNQLSSNTLSVGETLKLRTKSPAGTSRQKVVYRVRSGDSLSVIASRFDVRVSEIANWNNLKNRHFLKPGQRLTLYVDQG